MHICLHSCSPERSHFKVGRADHGIDLDLAYNLQKQLFLRCPKPDARKLINSLMDVLTNTDRTFPDLECLRALIVISVSPVLETPRTDDLTEEQLTNIISFKNEEPVDWYPTAAAGHKPGLVLGLFAMTVYALEALPSSILGKFHMLFRLLYNCSCIVAVSATVC